MLRLLFTVYNSFVTATKTCTLDAKNDLYVTDNSKIEMNIHVINAYWSNPLYRNLERFSLYYDNDYLFKSFRISYTLKLFKGSKVVRNDKVYFLKESVDITDCKHISVVLDNNKYHMVKIANEDFIISDSDNNAMKLHKTEALGIKLKNLKSFQLNDTNLSVSLHNVYNFNKFEWEYDGDDHNISVKNINFQNDEESRVFVKSNNLMFPMEKSFLKTLAQKYFVKRGWFQKPELEATIDKNYTVVFAVAENQGRVTLLNKVTVEEKVDADTKPTKKKKNIVNDLKDIEDEDDDDDDEDEEETTTDSKNKDFWSVKNIAILVGSIFGGLLILTLVIFLIFKGGSSNKTREIV